MCGVFLGKNIEGLFSFNLSRVNLMSKRDVRNLRSSWFLMRAPNDFDFGCLLSPSVPRLSLKSVPRGGQLQRTTSGGRINLPALRDEDFPSWKNLETLDVSI